MRVLIIGGTGLISGSITRMLKRQGHAVTVFHRGYRPLEVKGVTELIGYRQNRLKFETQMRALEFDAVFDMISFSAADAASSLRAFQGRVNQFIHCSTVCAVGAPLTKIPADEDEPYQPVSLYGRGKAAAEKLLLRAWRRNNFPVTIFRPSHTYGPGAHWVLGTLMQDWNKDCSLFNRILRRQPILVQGDGEQLWQSCYVDEVAEGFVGALGKKRVLGQIYNICGSEICTWNQYYVRVAKALGRKAILAHLPTAVIMAHAPKSSTGFLKDIAQYHGAYSNAKIMRDIPEFRPRTTIEQGSRMHLAWLKKKGSLRNAPDRLFEDQLCHLAFSLEKRIDLIRRTPWGHCR